MTAGILTVGSPVCERDEKGIKISARLSVGGDEHRLWYRVPDSPVAAGADAFVAAALPIAMRTHSDLTVRGALSPRLRRALATIQDIYHSWNPEWSKITVHATDVSSAGHRAGERAVGLFFSGGVDSFYLLLKRREEIDTLLFIHGYDVPLEDRTLRQTVAAQLQRAAARTGKRLLEVETNLHQISGRYVKWEFYHGAMLASVALLLGRGSRGSTFPRANPTRRSFPGAPIPARSPMEHGRDGHRP